MRSGGLKGQEAVSETLYGEKGSVAGELLLPQTLCVKLTPKAPLGPHPLLPLLAWHFTPSPFFPSFAASLFVSCLTNSKHDQLWN